MLVVRLLCRCCQAGQLGQLCRELRPLLLPVQPQLSAGQHGVAGVCSR
jgi:hypothetical protein